MARSDTHHTRDLHRNLHHRRDPDPPRFRHPEHAPQAFAMTESREAAIQRIQVLVDAAKDLQVAIRANEEVYRNTLRLLRSGTEMSKALTAVDVAQARTELADALRTFEADRHRTRSLVIAAQVDEGMNIKQVAQVWGISRQLAGRFLKEARSDT